MPTSKFKQLMKKLAKRGDKIAKAFLRITSKSAVKKANQRNDSHIETASEIARRHHPPPFSYCGGKRPKSLLVK
jgi:hypothetical protein